METNRLWVPSGDRHGKAIRDARVLILFKIIFIRHVLWSLPFWEYISISILHFKNHSISFFKFSGIAVYATAVGQLVFGVTFLELGK